MAHSLKILQKTHSHHIINVINKGRLPKIDYDMFSWLLQTNSRENLASDDVVDGHTWTCTINRATHTSLFP